MNPFHFLSAESAEDRMATVDMEEIFNQENMGGDPSIFQSEDLMPPQDFHLNFTDFGW
jgi:hypothetical protein